MEEHEGYRNRAERLAADLGVRVGPALNAYVFETMPQTQMLLMLVVGLFDPSEIADYERAMWGIPEYVLICDIEQRLSLGESMGHNDALQAALAGYRRLGVPMPEDLVLSHEHNL